MRDKQIEEMAKIMCKDCAAYGLCILAKSGKMCVDVLQQAEALYNAGYRKKYDVAREIFEEIDDKLLECISEAMKGIDRGVRANCVDEIKANLGAKIVLEALRGYIAKLKKKYLGEDINAPAKESEGEG